jgi:tetratricopeptide (TPR) repeat protein
MSSPSIPPSSHAKRSATEEGAVSGPLRMGPSLAADIGTRLHLRIALALLFVAAMPGIAGGPLRMALYGGAVLLALLVHELGHALCGLCFGSRASILLHVLGGYTTLEPALPRKRAVLATLAGPLASIGLGLLFGWARLDFPGHLALDLAAWTNLGWGIVNLLPVLPFDGGRALLDLVASKHRALVLQISGTLALAMAFEGLVVLHHAALGFVFAAAASASFVDWVKQRRVDAELALDLPEQLERAQLLVQSGAFEPARQLATRVGVRALRNPTANSAWELVAWAELLAGDIDEAYATLGRIQPATDVPSHVLAAVEAARGNTRHAIGLLQRARAHQGLSLAALKLLIDLYARTGSFERACEVAGASLGKLDVEDTRRVVEAALEANAFSAAAKLAGELFSITASPDDAVSHAYGLARLGERTRARRIFRELVALLSDWEMHKRTLARLRDLALHPDLSELIGPELSRLALAPA